MIQGFDLFFSLFNNLAIFIALVTVYRYLIGQFDKWGRVQRQVLLGSVFGMFAIGCMYAKIPVFDGVIVDQRNAIVTLSGAFGGPVSALISAVCAGGYRTYLGGKGVFAGLTGISLSAMAGIVMHRFPGCFTTISKAAVSALFATILILPGFLFVSDLQTGWSLMKAMILPYGVAIFCGIFLVGLLINNEEERLAFERSFRESEDKYRSLIEGMTDLVMHADEHGDLTFVNHPAETIFGLAADECIGMSLFQFVHPDDREMTEKWFNDTFSLKQSGSKIENRQVNVKTGVTRIFSWSSSLHYDASGSVTGIGAIGRDVTEYNRAEEERKKLEAQLSNALEMAGLGHWEYDIEKDLFLFNDHFYKIFNATAEAVGGYTMSAAAYAEQFVHPEDRYMVGKEIQKAIEETDPNRRHHLEHRMIYADGRIGHVFVQFFVIKDEYGNTIKTMGVNQDITERRRMEEQIQQAQKIESIGSLAGGIAHDFNNILYPIVGLSEMLVEDLPDGSPEHEYAENIFKAGRRATDLVKQILAFSRQTEHEMVPVRFQEILKEVIKLCRSTIPSNIEIRQEIANDCGTIMADPIQLHQISVNLITNAYHAVASNNGHITIRLKEIIPGRDNGDSGSLKSGRYVKLTISDSGTGIDPAIAKRIFDPYFTTKEKGKGTGLGLSVVHGIVKAHRGEIDVESEPGKGTTMRVCLPLMGQPADTMPSGDPEAIPSACKERILLVDDEAPIARLVKQMLERTGYRVTSHTRSDEALASFKNDPSYDLVITDMSMPGMTGDQLAKKILSITKDVPIIICTGFSEQMDQEEARAIGVKGFLMKPIIRSKLSHMVRKVLDEAQNNTCE